MQKPSVSLLLTAGIRKGGKLWDLMRSGEGMEKQGGGGSRGRLDCGMGGRVDERSSNCGSHGGGSSNGEHSSADVGCSDKNRICESRDMSARTTLRQSKSTPTMVIS